MYHVGDVVIRCMYVLGVAISVQFARFLLISKCGHSALGVHGRGRGIMRFSLAGVYVR